MPHLAHRCRCNQTIHWPKDAKIGDRWTCRTCRAVAVLAEEGRPGWIETSLPDAAENNPDYLRQVDASQVILMKLERAGGELDDHSGLSIFRTIFGLTSRRQDEERIVENRDGTIDVITTSYDSSGCTITTMTYSRKQFAEREAMLRYLESQRDKT